jgi:hypothetical protein
MTTSYGEIPGMFPMLIPSRPLSLVFATQTRNVRIQSIFDEQRVLMNTFGMWITPKAIQDLLDELEA